jgi:hypothetical protein
VLREERVEVEPVVGIAMVACWVFLYMVIGGRWPSPLFSGPLTPAMRWRALIATGLWIVILLAGAILGLWTIPPQTGG